MDTSKLRLGEMIAGISGLVLFISFFFTWYTVKVEAENPLNGQSISRSTDVGNLWQTLGFWRWIALLVVIVAVGSAILTMTQRSVALPVSASVLTTVLGILLVIGLVIRIFIDKPGGNVGGALGGLGSVDIKASFGAYLGLLASLGVVFGGYQSMRDEGSSFKDIGQGGSGGDTPASPPPPAAPPAA